MDFNAELIKLRKVKEMCESEIKDLDIESKKEIESAVKQVCEKYAGLKQPKYEKLEANDCEIDLYCQKIEQYSNFDERLIGNAISSLMSLYEGIDYIYQDAYYFTTVGESNVKKHPRLIVACENRCYSYSEMESENLTLLVKNGKALLLVDDADTLDNGICFYHANKDDHILEQSIEFGRFSYVKEFIDQVIAYKIENNSTVISYDELEQIKIEFIVSKVEKIEENYHKLAEEEEKQMLQILSDKKERRELMLRKTLSKKVNAFKADE